jgi:hypothetical protein
MKKWVMCRACSMHMETIMLMKFWLESCRGRYHLGHLVVDGRITVKSISEISVNWIEVA